MSAPALDQVEAWRTEPLLVAADELDRAAEVVALEAASVRRHLDEAMAVGGGAWATTAGSRAEQEARVGVELADDLGAAASTLRSGAAELAAARSRLLDTVARAREQGFVVGPDGEVTSPPAPRPDGALVPPPSELPERVEAAALVETRRVAAEADVHRCLDEVAAVDERLADALVALPLHQTPESAMRAHVARTLELGDPVAALGTVGGAVVAGQTARAVLGMVARGRSLTAYGSLARVGAAGSSEAAAALRSFGEGSRSRPLGKAMGKVFLPLTVVNGVQDAASGGGHDGARGWATRGLGLAGAAGAGAVMLAPVLAPGVVVAGGAAVLAYGAWQAGTYVADHWDQVEAAAEDVTVWAGEQAVGAAGEVQESVAWARDRLDALGDLF
ncbi:hypothetical protein [Nocardioides euryhalodurans]|uniref:Uncharacterized protein n=1 Tax=Nocardioides euryhalodurans TaxID=2518370 RepID=A0A4P7GM21_9ACTN|nr:hypothetical protein [Nocardioides euryhalodurans]QBR93195.1 hypothetical protein EXE57_13660 [Nocardioides euryhalodurans]